MDSETRAGEHWCCYDGSDGARQAIERAGQLLGGGEAIVLTVWESRGSALLRSLPPGGIAEDVVDEVDTSTAEAARATTREGAVFATRAGFDPRPLTPPAGWPGPPSAPRSQSGVPSWTRRSRRAPS